MPLLSRSTSISAQIPLYLSIPKSLPLQHILTSLTMKLDAAKQAALDLHNQGNLLFPFLHIH